MVHTMAAGLWLLGRGSRLLADASKLMGQARGSWLRGPELGSGPGLEPVVRRCFFGHKPRLGSHEPGSREPGAMSREPLAMNHEP